MSLKSFSPSATFKKGPFPNPCTPFCMCFKAGPPSCTKLVNKCVSKDNLLQTDIKNKYNILIHKFFNLLMLTLC